MSQTTNPCAYALYFSAVVMCHIVSHLYFVFILMLVHKSTSNFNPFYLFKILLLGMENIIMCQVEYTNVLSAISVIQNEN